MTGTRNIVISVPKLKPAISVIARPIQKTSCSRGQETGGYTDCHEGHDANDDQRRPIGIEEGDDYEKYNGDGWYDPGN